MQDWQSTTGHLADLEIGHVFFEPSRRAGFTKIPLRKPDARQAVNPGVLHVPSPRLPGQRLTELHLYGALFFAEISLFCLRKLADLPPGQLDDLLVMASCATCGWSWLLTRALFRDPVRRESRWAIAAVLLLTAVGILLQLAGERSNALTHMAGNLQRLLSSTLLVLALAEPLRTWHHGMPRQERQFRVAFAGSYAALVAVSAVWIGRSPEGSFGARSGDTVRIFCALVAMLLIGLALRYRHAHPLTRNAAVKARVPTASEEQLAARIRQLMAEGSLHAETHLKVSDLAKRLEVPEYKVTQCVTGSLGFPNFNQMVNHWRVERAKAMLGDAHCAHLPVLTIALDCGFGSIGPFNRAFKAHTGMTPTRFRSEASA
jgi:AraC-like DNA-binding protein